MTNERLLLTPFTGTLYIDEFRLIVPIAPEVPLGEMMLTPLKPFTPSAWKWIALLVMYMTVVLGILTGQAENQGPMRKEWPTLTSWTDYVAAKLGISRKYLIVDIIDATIGRVVRGHSLSVSNSGGTSSSAVVKSR